LYESASHSFSLAFGKKALSYEKLVRKMLKKLTAAEGCSFKPRPVLDESLCQCYARSMFVGAWLTSLMLQMITI